MVDSQFLVWGLSASGRSFRQPRIELVAGATKMTCGLHEDSVTAANVAGASMDWAMAGRKALLGFFDKGGEEWRHFL